jgi:hypothetical protein
MGLNNESAAHPWHEQQSKVKYRGQQSKVKYRGAFRRLSFTRTPISTYEEARI